MVTGVYSENLGAILALVLDTLVLERAARFGTAGIDLLSRVEVKMAGIAGGDHTSPELILLFAQRDDPGRLVGYSCGLGGVSDTRQLTEDEAHDIVSEAVFGLYEDIVSGKFGYGEDATSFVWLIGWGTKNLSTSS